MNSLDYLNGVGSTSVTFTDNRATGVVFDRPEGKDLNFGLQPTTSFNIHVGINIVEIINPLTANVRYKINFGTQNISLSWDSIPANVSVTHDGTLWEVLGIESVSDWEAMKSPTVTLDEDFFGDVSYDVTITYNTDAQNNLTKKFSIGYKVPVTICESKFIVSADPLILRQLSSSLAPRFVMYYDYPSILIRAETSISCELTEAYGMTGRFTINCNAIYGYNSVALSKTSDPYLFVYDLKSNNTLEQISLIGDGVYGNKLPYLETCMDWNHNGTSLAVGCANNIYNKQIVIYDRDYDSITEVASISNLPSAPISVSWNHDGTQLAVAHNSNPYLTVYNRSGTTFTKITGIPVPSGIDGPGYSVDWNHDGTMLAFGHNVFSGYTGLTLYDVSGNTFTINTDGDRTPTGNSVIEVKWSDDSEYLFAAQQVSVSKPFVLYNNSGIYNTVSGSTISNQTMYNGIFDPSSNNLYVDGSHWILNGSSYTFGGQYPAYDATYWPYSTGLPIGGFDDNGDIVLFVSSGDSRDGFYEVNLSDIDEVTKIIDITTSYSDIKYFKFKP